MDKQAEQARDRALAARFAEAKANPLYLPLDLRLATARRLASEKQARTMVEIRKVYGR